MCQCGRVLRQEARFDAWLSRRPTKFCKLQVVPIRWVRFQPQDLKRITFIRTPCNGKLLQLMCSIVMTFIHVRDRLQGRSATRPGARTAISGIFLVRNFTVGLEFCPRACEYRDSWVATCPQPQPAATLPPIFGQSFSQDYPKFHPKGRVPVDMQAHQRLRRMDRAMRALNKCITEIRFLRV